MPLGIYPRTYRPVEDRFWDKVSPEPNSGCWLWTGTAGKYGHGYIRLGGRGSKMLKAYRLSYEIHVGPIPDGLEIDHKCCNANCVNPSHLEAVTHRENVKRAGRNGRLGTRNRQKTHCPKGHPYNEQNTYVAPNGDRQCRACRKKYMREYHRNRKGKI